MPDYIQNPDSFQGFCEASGLSPHLWISSNMPICNGNCCGFRVWVRCLLTALPARWQLDHEHAVSILQAAERVFCSLFLFGVNVADS